MWTELWCIELTSAKLLTVKPTKILTDTQVSVPTPPSPPQVTDAMPVKLSILAQHVQFTMITAAT